MDENQINYELIEDLLRTLSATLPQGAILVFMPGLMEITRLFDQLLASVPSL